MFCLRSKADMTKRTNICETTKTVSKRLLPNHDLAHNPQPTHQGESHHLGACEGLSMVLATNTTSLALATSRPVTAGENEDNTPAYSTAVAEILQRARTSSNHTYRDGYKRSNTMKDLYFDPVSNEAEWKMQAR